MIPRQGQQVEILSAVHEIGLGRTESETVSKLLQRFNYLTRQQAETIYGFAVQSRELAETLGEASEGALMRHVTGLVDMPEGTRFVKVNIRSAVSDRLEALSDGLTDFITIHVQYNPDMTVEELIQAARDQAEEAGRKYAGTFFEGVDDVEIVGVF